MLKSAWRTALCGALTLVLGLSPASEAMLGVPGASLALGSVTLTSVYPRIITPNGDGATDKVGFHFENPELLPVEGKIFDLSGARVASLAPAGTDPTGLLLWDGKDSEGRSVSGGIYLYQIDFQGKNITGTVVVAR
jgi:hypothetical protein